MKRKTAIAFGTFDGLHKGHLAVLDLPEDYYKAVITFDYPPKASISGQKELLMSVEDKFARLEKMGINEIFSMNFADVKDMRATEFLEFIDKKYEPAMISCGFNYRFGKNGEGNIDTLKGYCCDNGIAFKCVEPVTSGEETVSSTLIREKIKNGDVERAAELLSEPFSFTAEVIHGEKRGRTIGFPTVNQKYPDDLIKLKFGVYKTKIDIGGKEYYGITNIGIRPTFKSDFVICETYIKEFSGNLYGETLRLTPLGFLREEIKFSSVEELKEQIKKDLIDC